MNNSPILIVDDDENILDALQMMLEDAGYEVVTAGAAQKARDIISQSPPCLILLDVFLSGADGRHLALEIRKNRKTTQIPIIMISAHPSAFETLQKDGRTEFLSKPFNLNELLVKVKKYVS